MKNKIIAYVLMTIVATASVAWTAEEWKEEMSRHFVVYYQNTPEEFVETVLDAAEDYYDTITDELGYTRYKNWSFDNRAKIYIYDTQQDYVESARQSHWSAGAAYYHSRTIRTFPSDNGFFDSLLPHELGHIIFHEFIGNRVRIPRWFDEGVAMYQERARRWGAHQQVKQALTDGAFVPLDQLEYMRLTHGSTQEEVELFYAEAASVVYFLIKEQGKFRFSNFCRRLQGGDKFPHALERTYPHLRTLKRLNDAWVSYLERM